ncbi:MAG TPA: hypothetical protein DEP23_14730 [Ruminococcaceae bacterium]|nr:hypothetical protein [Oscillospiraceae bacterium]
MLTKHFKQERDIPILKLVLFHKVANQNTIWFIALMGVGAGHHIIYGTGHAAFKVLDAVVPLFHEYDLTGIRDMGAITGVIISL